MSLEAEYRKRFQAVLEPLASALQQHLLDHCKGEPRIDRITARAKSVDRFLAKAQTQKDGRPKYTEPLDQIQDQVGARIVTFYRSDVERVAAIVQKYFRPIEQQNVIPDNDWEFGYFGRHFILIVPSDVIDRGWDRALLPTFFELQIKTLFQHAWSEANHDLGYKPGLLPLTSDEARRLAFTSAQAWGADHIFDELFEERTNGSASSVGQ
jgi:putative GTP pyrophosphokinase